MPSLLIIVDWLIEALQLLIIVSSLLSWFPISPGNRVVRLLHALVEPLLHPIRALLPTTLGMDFSPLVAILILWLLKSVLRSSIHVPRLS